MCSDNMCSPINFRFLHAAPKAKGKQVAEFAAQSRKTLDSSVSLRTAYRSKNRVLQQSTAFYEDDWCKLEEWGREFIKLNPGSVFKLKRDEKGRCVLMCSHVLTCAHMCSYVLMC